MTPSDPPRGVSRDELIQENARLREALEKIAAYWKPHTGLHDVLDAIAEIARAALERP